MKIQQLFEEQDAQSAVSHLISAATTFLHRQAKKFEPKDDDGVHSGDAYVTTEYVHMNTIHVDVALMLGRAQGNTESVATDIADKLIQFLDATIKHLEIEVQLIDANGGCLYKIGNKRLRVVVQQGFASSMVLVYQS